MSLVHVFEMFSLRCFFVCLFFSLLGRLVALSMSHGDLCFFNLNIELCSGNVNYDMSLAERGLNL